MLLWLGLLISIAGSQMQVAALHWHIRTLTGEPDRPPVRPGISTVDMSSGMMAFGAAMTALYARATGAAKGQRVDLSLLETAMSLLGYHALNYLMTGKLMRRELKSMAAGLRK